MDSSVEYIVIGSPRGRRGSSATGCLIRWFLRSDWYRRSKHTECEKWALSSCRSMSISGFVGWQDYDHRRCRSCRVLMHTWTWRLTLLNPTARWKVLERNRLFIYLCEQTLELDVNVAKNLNLEAYCMQEARRKMKTDSSLNRDYTTRLKALSSLMWVRNNFKIGFQRSAEDLRVVSWDYQQRGLVLDLKHLQ